MPNKTVEFLLKEVRELKDGFTQHLIESGGIKTQLKVNTWLTGVILAAILGKVIVDYFKP